MMGFDDFDSFPFSGSGDLHGFHGMDPTRSIHRGQLYNEDRPLISDASRTLFVGDLSYFCREEDLLHLFATFPVFAVRVRRGVTGDSLMHGFVVMETPDAARWGMNQMDGVEFMGRILR
jgi:RNA recognition motif-containing protein